MSDPNDTSPKRSCERHPADSPLGAMRTSLTFTQLQAIARQTNTPMRCSLCNHVFPPDAPSVQHDCRPPLFHATLREVKPMEVPASTIFYLGYQSCEPAAPVVAADPQPEKPLRTSDTHPLQVDFLPPETTRTRGRIGMCKAPGKKDPEGWHARWERDLDKDLARLRDVYETHVLVTLMEDDEMRARGMGALIEATRAHAIESFWHPVVDMGVPHDAAAFAALVRRVLAKASAGRNVVIHCKGGYGRTGTLAACVLVALGHDPEAAIAITRAARPGTIQTPEQEAYVRRFAATAP